MIGQATAATGAGILGIGFYLPQAVRPNSYFWNDLKLDTNDKWIRQRTGIRTRRVAAPDEYTSHLGTHAARKALEMAGVTLTARSRIVVATATPDQVFPATANRIQAKLNPQIHTPAFDINNACNGFILGLSLASTLVNADACDYVLLIGAELFSRFIDYKDRGTCILFGDGAAAVVVGRVEDPGPSGFVTYSDGTEADTIIYPGGGSVHPASEAALREGCFAIKMDGQAVFKKAVRSMADAAEEALKLAGLSKEAARWVIPHQANSRIIGAVGSKLDLADRTLDYIADFGNLSAASIPMAIAHAYADGWIQKGDNLLLTAIGAGLNWGAGVVRWHLPNPTPRPDGSFKEFRERQLAVVEGNAS